MEALTYGTLKLAEKTKQETVSMRIITLVTLAFLPGTFISVGLLVSASEMCKTCLTREQTLMSTDIIKFQNAGPDTSQQIVQLKAVKFYLAVSLPLVFGVFIAWYAVYLWETRKEKRNKDRSVAEDERKDTFEKV